MSMDAPNPITPEKPKGEITFARIAVWVIVGGVGLYLVVSGLIGVITKGS